MIEEFIATLLEFEELSELTGEQLSDILWLWSQKMQKSSDYSFTKEDSKSNPQTNKNLNRNTTSNTNPQKPSTEQSSNTNQSSTQQSSNTNKKIKVAIYQNIANENPSSKPGGGELSIRVPDAASLTQKLELARKLKSLKRRVPSMYSTILDETATIERIANEKLWIPVVKPALEPWLELALVVDESESMPIWKDTISELRQLLVNLGAFRDVRIWGLVINNQRQVQIRPGIGKAARNQNTRSPNELVDPNGRCLILVLSDCVSPMWRDGVQNGVKKGNIISVLHNWSKNGPVAIVQMLPKWLWGRTALGLASTVQLSGLTPGVANQQLRVKRVSLWDEINYERDIKVPVLTLEPQMANTWSQMVAGVGKVWTSGVVFNYIGTLNEDDEPEESSTTQITAKQRFQRFRLTASPMARRLAGLVAAAPIISLPVIRLIQATMLPQSQQVHVAEVLLGGLVKLKSPLQIETDTNPDDIEYEFIKDIDDEVGKILLESVPASDKANVKINLLERMTKYIADRIGLSPKTFAGFLKDPRLNSISTQQNNPIARIALDKLKQLGGKYKDFAQLLEQIKSFTFETLTVNRRGEIINRETKTAQYFTENIKSVGGEVIPLEMVYIPGGTFMMGSPEGEGDDDEKPQHQVTVQPFFMGKFQVTQGQWKVVANLPQVDRELKPEPSYFKAEDNQKNNLPVEKVSWYDAEEFCKRLSKHTGKQYRLASEAEWEYACRAGTTTPFHFGETIISELANYDASRTFADEPKGEDRGKTTPVGQFFPNAFGLYDMHGNLWEWCLDHWHDNYEDSPTDGSVWLNKAYENDNHYRVLRGGSWFDNPGDCRSADRFYNYPDLDYYFNGFRVVCGVSPQGS